MVEITKECPQCGKETREQLANGEFWCSWCNNSFDASESGSFRGRGFLDKRRWGKIPDLKTLDSLILCLSSKTRRYADGALGVLQENKQESWVVSRIAALINEGETPEASRKKLEAIIANPPSRWKVFWEKLRPRGRVFLHATQEKIHQPGMAAKGMPPTAMIPPGARPIPAIPPGVDPKPIPAHCDGCGRKLEYKGDIPVCKSCGFAWCPRCGHKLWGTEVYRCAKCHLTWCRICFRIPPYYVRSRFGFTVPCHGEQIVNLE